MSTSKSTKTKNSQPPESEVELNFDLDELREEMGVVALEERIAQFEQILTEMLTYFNVLDERVQQLQGDPVVTARHQMNIGDDGRIEVLRQRPSLPSNLINDGPRSLPRLDK